MGSYDAETCSSASQRSRVLAQQSYLTMLKPTFSTLYGYPCGKDSEEYFKSAPSILGWYPWYWPRLDLNPEEKL